MAMPHVIPRWTEDFWRNFELLISMEKKRFQRTEPQERLRQRREIVVSEIKLAQFAELPEEAGISRNSLSHKLRAAQAMRRCVAPIQGARV